MINQYAQVPKGPGGIRHYSLSLHLRQHGWHSCVIAGSCEHNTGFQRLSPDEYKRCEQYDGVSFLWLRVPGSSKSDIRSRFVAMCFFTFWLLWPCATRTLSPPDIVMGSTVHPFAALAGFFLAWRHRVPFVFEVRDLWPFTLVAMGTIKEGNVVERLLAFLERWLARQASCIIVLMPGGFSYFEALGIPSDRLLWLPNGAEVPPTVTKPLRHHAKPFQLLYCGAHGQANALDTVLDAMLLLQDRGIGPDQLVLRLIGDGPLKPVLRQRANQYGLGSVFFEDPVPKNELLPMISEADGFVVAMQPLPELYRYGISFNKLFDYFSAGRPIVSASCAAYDPVKAADAGFVVPAGDHHALADAINRLRELPCHQRQRLGDNGRAYLELHNTYPLLARRLAGRLNDLVAESRADQNVPF